MPYLITTQRRIDATTIYVEAAYWHTSHAKSQMLAPGYERKHTTRNRHGEITQPGDVRIKFRDRVIYCHAVNAFRVQIPTSGERVITRDNDGVTQFQLTDRRWVTSEDIANATEQQRQRIKFAKEKFAITKEEIQQRITDCAESWWTRELDRAKRANPKDRNGRLYGRRFAGRTTLNLQVSAGGDDGYFGTGFYNSDTQLFVGRLDHVPWNVFAKFAVPAIGSLDACVVQFYHQGSYQALYETRIALAKEQSPSTPADLSDANSRVRTTAFVAHYTATGGWNSFDLLAAAEEVLAATGIDGGVLVFHDQYSTQQTYYTQWHSYESNPTYAPKLDIDYTAPLTSPDNILAEHVGGGTVTLTWDDLADGETAYELQRKLSGGEYATITDEIAANAETYDDTGLDPGDYVYRIRALGAGDPSDWSNEAEVTVASPSSANGRKRLGLGLGL